ncbi:hypothetical protein KAR34_07235 [bacterium]|nr:hypothetical protein [bacterium]
MTFYEISWILLLLINFVFALLIFYNARRNLSRWKVGFLAIATGIWILGHGMLKVCATIPSTSFWAREIFVGSTSIIFVVYWLSLSFIEKKLRLISINNYIMLFLYIFVLSVLISTDLFLAEFNPEGKNLVEKAPMGPWFLILLIIYVYAILQCVINFLYAYKNSSIIIKNQLLYVAYSTLATIVVAIVTAGFLPAMNNNSFVWLAPYGAVIYLSGITYAIFRYRLLDITIIIKRTTLYLVIIGLIMGCYTFVLMLPQNLVGAPGSPGSISLMVFAAIIVAVTIQPLRDWLDSVTDRLFFQKRYDYYLVLERVSRELNSVLKNEEVFDIVARSLVYEVHVKNIAIYIKETAGASVFGCHKKDGENAEKFPDILEEENPFLDYLSEQPLIMEAGEFRHKYGHLYQEGRVGDQKKADVQRILDEDFQGGLIIPLVLKKSLIGFVVLGEKKSGDLFTHRDLTMLETLSSQMSTALENINLYEKMLNNERLTIIGTMSAGIAHEIRNPLASIKTFIQMLPAKYDRPDFRQRFNEIVPAEIERLSNITADLLTFSKPSAPSLEAVSIQQILNRISTLLNSQIRKKVLKVEKDMGSLPDIQADSQQIFQVLLNIILNAIHASKNDGYIRITAEVKKTFQGRACGSGSFVLLYVEDNGCGIKRKDMGHIFEPFFTTKSEGTGLGLATCKRIIEAHRGDIFVESEENRGTKFTVMLPMQLTSEVLK